MPRSGIAAALIMLLLPTLSAQTAEKAAEPSVLERFDGADRGFRDAWSDAAFAKAGVLDAKAGYFDVRRKLARRLDRTIGGEVWIALTGTLSAPLTGKGNIYRAFAPANTGQHFFFGFRAEKGEGRHLLFESRVCPIDGARQTTTLLRLRFFDASYEISAWTAEGDGKSIDPAKDAPWVSAERVAKPAVSEWMFNADQAPGVTWRILRLAEGENASIALGRTPGADETKPAEKPGMNAFDRLLAKERFAAARSPILFFGDSITQAGGYIRMFEALLAEYAPEKKIELINAGISGHKVPDLLGRFERDVAAKKPKTVVIYIGVNDVWHQVLNGKGTPPDVFERGLRELVEKTRAIGAEPMFVTLATVGERTDGKNELDPKLDEYRAITLRVARETKAVCRDLRAAFMRILAEKNGAQAKSGILTTDGVHMRVQGDEVILDEVLSGLAEIP